VKKSAIPQLHFIEYQMRKNVWAIAPFENFCTFFTFVPSKRAIVRLLYLKWAKKYDLEISTFYSHILLFSKER